MTHLDDAQREALAMGAADVDAAAQAHHAGCAECQAAVRDAKARRAMLAGLTPYTLSDMAFRRVEARLVEQVEAGLPARRPWLAWLAPVVLAAAALVVLVVSSWREAGGPDVVALPVPPPVAAPAPFHPLTVLRAAAGSQVRTGEDGAWRPLGVGDVLAAGDAVSSDGVVLAPASGVRWAFAARGALALGGAATVSLGAGQVTARVGRPAVDAAGAREAPALVAAGRREVSAVDALFAVSRSAAEVVLSVGEGAVDVTDSVTRERRHVEAPATLRWADGAGLADAKLEAPSPVTAPAVPALPWVRFDASTLPAGTAISLDGAALGEAPLLALVGGGRHRLGLTPPGRPLTESWVELAGEGPFIAALPDAPEGPAPSADSLARLQQELLRHRPKLAACYEKWLKANPTASGTVELSLVVSASGRVKSARVAEGVVPKASAECLVRTAKGLPLPPLGAEAELEVPLVFTSGR